MAVGLRGHRAEGLSRWFSHDESERLWQDVVTAGDGCVFVAEDEGGVFGFASGTTREKRWRDLREYEGELQTVYVLPSHQGTGTGRRLSLAPWSLHFADNGVNSMLLWVVHG
ncbi:GNAT family N-acetyltransferase [Rubrobacter tropicus]|uniref:GNAT family N-acetyltransferase n=1 Tax=Rubrobacter tropicus TaxID=2653851 RepID=A0A6G8QET4_9ACTN|nr:GNAT family N-acetyltransferase [Rubrobacter tropicus]